MPEESGQRAAMTLQLAAHQRELVDQVIAAEPPARFVVTAPPGSGSSTALAASVAALRTERQDARCLVVVPAVALTAQWADQIARCGESAVTVITPQVYRRLQAETGEDENVWSAVSCVVVTNSFLKAQERIDEALEAPWDLVIVDEVHHSTPGSQTGAMAQRLWRSQEVRLAVAASTVPELPEWLSNDESTTKIRWTYSMLMRQAGVPRRTIHTVSYAPSELEQQIVDRVGALVKLPASDRAAQFRQLLLTRRVSSSIYALEQTLRRMLAVESILDSSFDDLLLEETDEHLEAQFAEVAPVVDRESIAQVLQLIEEMPTDSKWECCFDLLKRCGIGQDASGLIFTEYVDTAEYLLYLATSRNLHAFAVTGVQSTEENARALEGARSTPSLLIVTAASEGMDLSFANQVIHYDLPWSPKNLLRRIGRVERVYTRYQSYDHYYILGKEGASKRLDEIMKAVQALEVEWK